MKTIVVTGTNSGIGYEICTQAANLSYTVISISRNIEPLSKVNGVESHSVDITDKKSISDFVEDLSKRNIKIDILINNAGALVNKPFLEINENDMEHVYNVNVFSVFKIIQGLLPYLSDEAHVLNISSVGGLQGSVKFSGLSAYSSSKAALIALTECLAEEYKSTKWSFNCLALGAVQTEMLKEAFPDYQAPISAKQMADYIVRFAISDALYYNGKVISVSSTNP